MKPKFIFTGSTFIFPSLTQKNFWGPRVLMAYSTLSSIAIEFYPIVGPTEEDPVPPVHQEPNSVEILDILAKLRERHEAPKLPSMPECAEAIKILEKYIWRMK